LNDANNKVPSLTFPYMLSAVPMALNILRCRLCPRLTLIQTQALKLIGANTREDGAAARLPF
jgi:hypothetical protein